MDEMSPEYQQRLEEHIRQQIIQQNMESAWENSPEVFSDVYMLYVNMQINNIDLKVGWGPSCAGNRRAFLALHKPDHGCCRSLWTPGRSAAS